MKIKQIEAEVLSALSRYDEAGLIDRRTLRLNLDQEATKFGNDVMIDRYELLEVKGFFADLPKGFWNLESAVRYNTISEEESPNKVLFKEQYTYKQTEERSFEFDEETYEHYLGKYKQITELVPVRHTMKILKHVPSEILQITKRLSPDLASSGTCALDNIRKGLTNQVKVINRTLQATFKEGKVLIHYKSLPIDSDGDVTVPDEPKLTDYLKNNAILGVLEDIFLKEDFPNLANQISYYRDKTMHSRVLAQTSLKMTSLGNTWGDRLKRRNRRIWRT